MPRFNSNSNSEAQAQANKQEHIPVPEYLPQSLLISAEAKRHVVYFAERNHVCNYWKLRAS